MAEYEVVDGARLRDVADWLNGWEWPLTQADCASRAADFGWTVIDEDPGKGDIFETGLMTTRSWAMSDVRRGEVFEFTIFTSPVVGASPEGLKHVADTFAAQVRTVTDVVGEPAHGEPGVAKAASWQLVSGAVLRLGRTEQSCSWSVCSPWFAQLQRDVSEYEDDVAEQQY